MTLATLAPIATSAIYGLGFYQSYRYSRSLAVGWKEQTGLCAFDHIGNLAMLVIMGYSNIEALKGTAFANRIWNWSYSTYVLIPAMYCMVNYLAEGEKREMDYIKLGEAYPASGESDVRTLGERIQERFYCDGIPKAFDEKFPKESEADRRTLEERIETGLQAMQGNSEYYELRSQYQAWGLSDAEFAQKLAADEAGGSGILKAIVRNFPKNGEGDRRTLGERIDAAQADHRMSDLQKTLKSTLDFAFMHVSDFVLIASVIHTVAAIRMGFNKASNLVQLTFYAWAVLEQGLFWTQPEEDRGPLISFQDGDFVRAYDPTVSTLTSYLALPFQFFYKGITGKLTALMSALLRFTPDSWKGELIPDNLKALYQKAREEIEENEQIKNLKVLPEVAPDLGKRVYDDYAIPFDHAHCLKPLFERSEDFFRGDSIDTLEGKLREALEPIQDGRRGTIDALLIDLNTYANEGGEEEKRAVKTIFGILRENCQRDLQGTVEEMMRDSQRLQFDRNSWGYTVRAYAQDLSEARMAPVMRYAQNYEQSIASLLPTPHQRLACTEKMLQVFRLQDHFAEKSLTELEQALQAKLREPNDPYMEQHESAGTHREMLEHLIGTGGNKGYLHQHVIACRDRGEKEEKELYLKNIFGWVLQDWEERRKNLVERHGDFLCRTATGGTLQQLAYETYGDLLNGKSAGRRTSQELRRDLVEMGIQLILQQRRDLVVMSGMQGGAYALLEQQDRIEREIQDDRARRFEEAAEEGGVRARAQAYGLAGLQYGAFQFAKQVVMGIGTSRHTNNFGTVLIGKNLGLSHYAEARRDVEIQMHRRFLDMSLFDTTTDLLNPFTDLMQVSNILYRGADDKNAKMFFEELVDAIVMKEDKRLDFNVVKQYIQERFQPTDQESVTILETLRKNPQVHAQMAGFIRDGYISTEGLREGYWTQGIVATFFTNFARHEEITADNVHQFQYLDEVMACIEYVNRLGIPMATQAIAEPFAGTGVDPFAVAMKHLANESVTADVEALKEPDNTLFDERIVGKAQAEWNLAHADQIGEAYQMRAKAFLYKYMPQILYDMGFMAERTKD